MTSHPPGSAEAAADRADFDALYRAARDLVQLVEGLGCARWQDGHGARLKDTNEWARFYVAAAPARQDAQAPTAAEALLHAWLACARYEGGRYCGWRITDLNECRDRTLAYIEAPPASSAAPAPSGVLSDELLNLANDGRRDWTVTSVKLREAAAALDDHARRIRELESECGAREQNATEARAEVARVRRINSAHVETVNSYVIDSARQQDKITALERDLQGARSAIANMDTSDAAPPAPAAAREAVLREIETPPDPDMVDRALARETREDALREAIAAVEAAAPMSPYEATRTAIKAIEDLIGSPPAAREPDLDQRLLLGMRFAVTMLASGMGTEVDRDKPAADKLRAELARIESRVKCP